MKKFLKQYQSWISYGVIIGIIAFAIWMLSGCATRPPTAAEKRWFNIQTNPPVIVQVTNVVPITVFKTNEVTMLPEQQTVWQTNTITVTNIPESYVYTPGAGAKAIQETGAAVGNIFGVGGLVGTGLGALFSVWGMLRSRKQYVTSANLAQTVETLRAFIQNLPKGASYDAALVSWMQAHQAEAGVMRQVLDLLAKEVSPGEAQSAALRVREGIDIVAGLQPKPTT